MIPPGFLPETWSMPLLDRLFRPARAIGALLRRPEMILFLPAASLAAFWFGGERVLVLVALGAPLLFAMVGAFHPAVATPAMLPDALGGWGCGRMWLACWTRSCVTNR
mgnify:CR=1 FL=1